MRPTTDGCSELSCMYHGVFNRIKLEHDEGCPVRALKRAVDPEDLMGCECANPDEGLYFMEDDYPPGFDEQYDRESDFDIGGEG
jgi:hypothetical protein